MLAFGQAFGRNEIEELTSPTKCKHPTQAALHVLVLSPIHVIVRATRLHTLLARSLVPQPRMLPSIILLIFRLLLLFLGLLLLA
eukprot:7388211-Prymnesium_polylepis.1